MGLVVTLLQIYGGAALGAIPSLLLFWGMMWLAKTLCLQWDVSCLKKNARAAGISLYWYVARDVSPEILQELEKMEGRYDNTHGYFTSFITAPISPVVFTLLFTVSHRPIPQSNGHRREPLHTSHH